jgi:hypothetical protein
VCAYTAENDDIKNDGRRDGQKEMRYNCPSTPDKDL